MPYYLTRHNIELNPGSPRPVRVPYGGTEKGASWIRLKDTALIWLPSWYTDKELTPCADDKAERMAGAGKITLQNFLTDRQFEVDARFNLGVADFLLRPPAGRWKAITPSKRRQRLEIWCGPPEDKLMWSQPAVVGKNSRTIEDTFTRSNGLIDGSTTSDGKGTWLQLIVTGTLAWAVVSNHAELNPANTSTQYAVLWVNDYPMDTDDEWVQDDFALTRVSGNMFHSLYLRIDDTGSEGYGLYNQIWPGANGIGIYSLASPDDIAWQADAQQASGTLRFEADGSSLSAYIDGNILFGGPVTNTEFLISDKQLGFDGYTSGDAGNLIVVDNWQGGDIVAGPVLISVSDAGQGADALSQVAVGFSLSDAGAGTDTFAGQAALELSDAGAAADGIAFIGALIQALDGAGGLDDLAISARLDIADAGAGTDSASSLISLTIADSGQGADLVPVIGAALSVADSASALDAISRVAAALTSMDAGAGIDAIAVEHVGETRTVMDAGVGLESIGAVSVQLALADSGAAADLVARLQAALNVSDQAGALDAVTIAQRLATISDAGSGSDALGGVSVSMTLADAGKAADLVARVIASLKVTDAGAGLDVATAALFLAKGKVRVTFTVKVPGVDIAVKMPRVSVEGQAPSIGISGKTPQVSITGKTPKITITKGDPTP